MKPTFLQKLSHWFSGLVQGCLQGGAVAAKATCAIAAAHSVGAPVPELDWRQMAWAFVGAAVFHAWDYLSKNPIPIVEEEIQQEKTEGAEGLPGQGNLPGAAAEVLISN